MQGTSVLRMEGFRGYCRVSGYSDSLVFLLIDLLSTKTEPAGNRSLTHF